MYFRGCRLVSGGCCSMGFVLGGTITVMMVLYVMDNSTLKHEKPKISESTEKLQTIESTKKPQISESTEKTQISESTEKTQISESTEKPQISESTEKTQISESTEKPQTSESTKEPQISESTEKPQTSESTKEPQINESTEKPQTSESTKEPQISESTKEPQTSESTEKPQISESNEKPQISESTKEPQISESNEKPQISESNEKPQISESTKEPQISESNEKPQISESTEKTEISLSTEDIIQISEKSKRLKQNISLDWSKALKFYSYKNMRNLTYKVRHKIQIKHKKSKAKRLCLVVVKNQLWFSVYGTIRVYSRKGKFIKSLKVKKKLVLKSGIETGHGDICFATDKKALVGFDSNGKYQWSKTYTYGIYDVAYDRGILYGLKDRRNKRKEVVKFTINGNRWDEIQRIRFQEPHNKSPIKYEEIEVRKNTIYALINKKLHLFNISNVLSSIRSYNLPKGSEIDKMNLLGVDPDGVSLLLDLKQRVLRLCTEDGVWSIVSRLLLTRMLGKPKRAVVDPIDNGIWVVYKDNKSSHLYKYILYNIIQEE